MDAIHRFATTATLGASTGVACTILRFEPCLTPDYLVVNGLCSRTTPYQDVDAIRRFATSTNVAKATSRFKPTFDERFKSLNVHLPYSSRRLPATSNLLSTNDSSRSMYTYLTGNNLLVSHVDGPRSRDFFHQTTTTQHKKDE